MLRVSGVHVGSLCLLFFSYYQWSLGQAHESLLGIKKRTMSVRAVQVVSINIFLRLDNCAIGVSSGICLRFCKKLTRYASALYRCGSSEEWTRENENELSQMRHRGMGCRASIEICLQYTEKLYSRNILVNTRLILSLHHAVDITSARISSSACQIKKD